MRLDFVQIIPLLLYGAAVVAIARDARRVAKAKGFDYGIATILAGALALIGLIPGLVVMLVYRLMKPRKDWSF